MLCHKLCFSQVGLAVLRGLDEIESQVCPIPRSYLKLTAIEDVVVSSSKATLKQISCVENTIVIASMVREAVQLQVMHF